MDKIFSRITLSDFVIGSTDIKFLLDIQSMKASHSSTNSKYYLNLFLTENVHKAALTLNQFPPLDTRRKLTVQKTFRTSSDVFNNVF